MRCGPSARKLAPWARLDRNGIDDGNKYKAHRGGRGLFRRSPAGARLGRRDRGAVELRAARQSSERRRHGAQAQGVLCRRTRRSGRGPSRLRPLRGEAGAAGPPARGPDAGARRGRGEGGGRRCLAHGFERSGQPLSEPLSSGAGNQHARLRSGGRGRGGPPGETGDVPAGRQRRSVHPPVGKAARLRPRGRRGSWRVSCPRAVAPRGAGRAEGPGLAARLLCT